jgi:hypothetical protein
MSRKFIIAFLTAVFLAAPVLALTADHATAATPLNNRSDLSNTAPKTGNGKVQPGKTNNTTTRSNTQHN